MKQNIIPTRTKSAERLNVGIIIREGKLVSRQWQIIIKTEDGKNIYIKTKNKKT